MDTLDGVRKQLRAFGIEKWCSVVLIANALPDSAHVVRYIKPTHIVDGNRIIDFAFRLRPQDNGLSVNWLEWFAGLSKDDQLQEVRRLTRIEMKAGGRLAEFNVGETLRPRPQRPARAHVRPPPVVRRRRLRSRPVA